VKPLQFESFRLRRISVFQISTCIESLFSKINLLERQVPNDDQIVRDKISSRVVGRAGSTNNKSHTSPFQTAMLQEEGSFVWN
jgi:hypothetical protein